MKNRTSFNAFRARFSFSQYVTGKSSGCVTGFRKGTLSHSPHCIFRNKKGSKKFTSFCKEPKGNVVVI